MKRTGTNPGNKTTRNKMENTTTTATAVKVSATRVNRNYRSEISAESYADLSNGMKLRFHTGKGYRGVTTYAQAVNPATDGHGESFVIFQDYNKTFMTHPEVKRVTEKAIEEAHNRAMQKVEEIIAEAEAHYKK